MIPIHLLAVKEPVQYNQVPGTCFESVLTVAVEWWLATSVHKTGRQSCGSGFIESGSGYGSGISSESGSGSNTDPWFWWPKTEEKIQQKFFFLFLIQNCNLLLSKLHVQEKPSALKENIQRFKKLKFIRFSLCLWVFFALLNPDTDTGPLLNPNPIRIRIRIHSTAGRYRYQPFGMIYDWSRRAYVHYTCVACALIIVFLPVWQLTINISWRHKIGHSRSSLVQGYFIVTTFKILRRKCSVNSLSLVEGYLQQ